MSMIWSEISLMKLFQLRRPFFSFSSYKVCVKCVQLSITSIFAAIWWRFTTGGLCRQNGKFGKKCPVVHCDTLEIQPAQRIPKNGEFNLEAWRSENLSPKLQALLHRICTEVNEKPQQINFQTIFWSLQWGMVMMEKCIMRMDLEHKKSRFQRQIWPLQKLTWPTVRFSFTIPNWINLWPNAFEEKSTIIIRNLEKSKWWCRRWHPSFRVLFKELKRNGKMDFEQCGVTYLSF